MQSFTVQKSIDITLDPTPIQWGQNVCIIGKRTAGKTTLIKDLIHGLSRTADDVLIVFCQDKTEYTDLTDNVYEACNERILCSAMETMQRKIFVFDDIVLSKSPIIFKIFAQSRHYNCTSIVATQYPGILSRPILANIDKTFA